MNVEGLPAMSLKGADVWYLGEHAGTTWIRRITGESDSRIDFDAVDISKWPFSNHNPSFPAWKEDNRGQIVVLNKLELLDHEREWFYDGTTLYFRPPGGVIPPAQSVEVPTRKSNLRIAGDHVVVQGINSFGGNVEITGDHSTLAESRVIYGMERLDSLDNTSASTSDASIEVGGTHVSVLGNTVEHSSFSGILVRGWSAADVLIEGNTVRNTDTAGIHATPIRSKAPRVRILKNTIAHAGRDGIFVSGQYSEVAYNDISHATKINDDSGVFYTVGDATERRHIEIHHNWFHDSYGPDYANQKTAGIYLDNRSKGFLVHHNVVWNISWSGIQLNWDTWENDMFHNTIWNTGGAMDAWVNGYVQKDNRIFNNYADSGDWLTDGYELKNNVLDPSSPFEDAGSLNFMPAAGSALENEGAVIAGFDKIALGAAPDVGAYERGGTAWTAGVDAVEDE